MHFQGIGSQLEVARLRSRQAQQWYREREIHNQVELQLRPDYRVTSQPIERRLSIHLHLSYQYAARLTLFMLVPCSMLPTVLPARFRF